VNVADPYSTAECDGELTCSTFTTTILSKPYSNQ